MGFAAEYFRATWKPLVKLSAIAAVALFLGVGIRAKFDLLIMVLVFPFSIILPAMIIFGSYLWDWWSEAHYEAERRGLPFEEFIGTEDYRRFLLQKAPRRILKNMRW